VDERTVRLTLSEPYGPLLATLASGWAAIVPREEVEQSGDLQATMVGTGPFALTEYTADTRTVMSAFAGYWEADLPELGTLTWNILPDESSRLAAIRTGEIGLTTLADAASVELAGQSEGVQVINQETTDYYLLGLNTQEAPFDNVAVRQAISLAVDRQAIMDTVFFGNGSVTGPIVPTLGDWATPVDQLPLYSRDLDRARELLAEAGLEDGFTMSIVASPLYPEFINIALVIQQQLQEVGITVELDQVEWGTFIDRWVARDFQSFVSFNGSGNDPDRALYPVFHTGGSVNAFQFSDEAIDALLEQGRTTLDPAERREIYRETEQQIAEAAPAIFLSTRLAYFAHRDDVTGFEPNPIDTWDTLKQTTVSGS
jgi:peptide/nickel transport system substrate-binding protein